MAQALSSKKGESQRALAAQALEKRRSKLKVVLPTKQGRTRTLEKILGSIANKHPDLQAGISGVLQNHGDERLDLIYRNFIVYPKAKTIHVFYNCQRHKKFYEAILIEDPDIKIQMFYNRGKGKAVEEAGAVVGEAEAEAEAEADEAEAETEAEEENALLTNRGITVYQETIAKARFLSLNTRYINNAAFNIAVTPKMRILKQILGRIMGGAQSGDGHPLVLKILTALDTIDNPTLERRFWFFQVDIRFPRMIELYTHNGYYEKEENRNSWTLYNQDGLFLEVFY